MKMKYRIKGLGWLPDPYDHRDLSSTHNKAKDARKVAAERTKGFVGTKLASRGRTRFVDLSDKCTRIENQGQIGSCTAHAVIGLLEYLWKNTEVEFQDGSRLFLYKTTRNLLGWTGDSGAYVRTAIKAARFFGVCPERYYDYDEARFNDEPTAFHYSLAAAYKSLVYYRLVPRLKDLKESLDHGIPFAFGFSCFESIDDEFAYEHGQVPFPSDTESLVGGHAVMAVGYHDDVRITNPNSRQTTTGAFLIRNSWGSEWGSGKAKGKGEADVVHSSRKRGYGWLPYQYFDPRTQLADDCWCILKSEYEPIKVAVTED